MAKHSSAVYSDSSADGKWRLPFCTHGSHSCGSWKWLQSARGHWAISAMLWRRRCSFALAPPKQQAEYRWSDQRPLSHMATSSGVHQWRLLYGFSRTDPPPLSTSWSISDSTKLAAALSCSTLASWDPVNSGRPSGCFSDLNGRGGGRPSPKSRGISLALLLVEQSKAAAMKRTDCNCSCNDCWRRPLDYIR